jgi:NADH-quinone oxidoreductase subunit K
MSVAGAIPMEHGLLLAAILFALGLGGLVLRRNMLFMLMSLEIMMNATGLAFVVGGARWGIADGQVLFVLVLTLQAAEACVGLALLILMYRRFQTLDVDAATTMRG